MADFVPWLLDQIVEDERDVHEWASWAEHESGTSLGFALGGLPDRLRAECDAKRRRITFLQKLYDECLSHEAPFHAVPHLFRIEALPYADRPGYREEWRP